MMNLALHEKRRLLEQRKEPRQPAEGPVLVRFADPQPEEILGQLMDVSPSGFRMAHANQSLQSGQVVDFSHSLAAGAARVMWNRITDQRVETGFLIVTAK
ncbi:MAG: PilZ domain-containing protein [Acidobacteriia bacterium]|nr:PilZ domain-containing protein [Terriglobia bacterium]